jgi:hypothetical protein
MLSFTRLEMLLLFEGVRARVLEGLITGLKERPSRCEVDDRLEVGRVWMGLLGGVSCRGCDSRRDDGTPRSTSGTSVTSDARRLAD